MRNMSFILIRPLKEVILAGVLLASIGVIPSRATDSDNCLMCHRYRGLARVEKDGTYRLFYIDEELFSKGPHVRVSCKGCHADIDEIPHNTAEKVNCLRECHIQEPNREILFSHSGVKESLDKSVHSPYDKEGNLHQYAVDFPTCKDCHDAPLFRPVSLHKSMHAGVSERAISRCIVCHQDESFIRYFYSHVTTRLHKARDPREVIDMCSSCHSDPAFLKRHDLPDVVASYLETYHGKAILFGSKKTPDCLDCHAQKGNVHEMKSKDDIRSSVNTASLIQTCRSVDCHPDADPSLTKFHVHATRTWKTFPIEFSVGLFFVLMTLAVLLPILTLSVLSLIREFFPSHEAEKEVERLTGIAQQKANRENGIIRFSVSQRIQHVTLLICFAVLALTGIPMKFPKASWAPFMYDLFGGIEVAPVVHRVAAVIMMIGFIFHLSIIGIGVFSRLRKSGKWGPVTLLREIYNLPMIPNLRDLQDLWILVKYVLYISPQKPLYGRFSWKEKLEYIGICWGTPLLGVTGLILWGEELFSPVVPGWMINIAYLVHTYESFLAIAHIVLVHLPGVFGRPGLSPLSAMFFSGKINPHVLAEEHGNQVKAFETSKEVQS